MKDKLFIFKEVWYYLKHTKRWWLVPLVFLFIVLSFIVIFAETSVFAPLIYTLF